MASRSDMLVAATVMAVSLLTAHPSQARDAARSAEHPTPRFHEASPSLSDNTPADRRRAASAFADALVLASWTFDASGGGPSTEGWTVHDRTLGGGGVTLTHVDDFAGLNGGDFGRLHPNNGNRSMWCGIRPGGPDACAYATLPGYGNSMDQTLTVRDCLHPVGDAVFSYYLTWDVEFGYDFVGIEIDHCDDNWTAYPTGSVGCGYYGGAACSGFTGVGVDSLIPLAIPAADNQGQFRVRIRATSDAAWSDEDGLYSSDGAYITDDLEITDANGVLVPLEDFEGAPLGATEVADWVAGAGAGYGTFAGLVPGTTTLQLDPCTSDLSYLWAFYVGSTYNYACGGYPSVPAVPFGNAQGQYLNNEIRSPWFDNVGSGSEYLFEFDVMRDLPFDNLVFFDWQVRSLAGTCPGPWKNDNFIHYGGQKDWLHFRASFGALVDPGATQLQVAFGVWDACGVWCGQFGSGACHSNAPLFDNPRVLRVDFHGPRWTIRDIDQFQDTFEEISNVTRKGTGEFTPAGRARADMANDISPGDSYNSNLPGDSSVVTVKDAENGLGLDGGSAAVYLYTTVLPAGQPNKSGATLSGNPAQYPYRGTWTDAVGTVWTILQCDSAFSTYVPDTYSVDLNDTLFQAGDEIRFFYEAKNAAGIATWASGSDLQQVVTDREAAAVNCAEFSVLPTANGGDILYVDGMDGRGAQPFWDTAFWSLAIMDEVDRFDVRGPSSAVGNRLAGRVKNVSQLVPRYRKILWDAGDLSVGLGNGSGSPEKTNDYRLLNQFLAAVTPSGGVFVSGDDALEVLDDYQASAHPNGVDAITFESTYLPFSLTTDNHRDSYGISPVGTAVVGGIFTTDTSVILAGGCPLLNDFDVVEPEGATTNQMTCGAGTATSTNGAVIGKVTGRARVIFSGFGFSAIEDDDLDGVSDRAAFLHDVIVALDNVVSDPTPAGPVAVNRLSQNYPNPFNPQTTIAFSVKQRGRVRVSIYDVSGRLVRTLADGDYAAGAHTVAWDGTNQAGSPTSSGVYFYKLVARDFSQTRKMVLLK